MGRTWGRVFRGARMFRIWWMSSAVKPVWGASCAALARGGEGRSYQRREADAVAYMAAIRTCSVSLCTMRWFSPSRSRGMVASAFRVGSVMARLGPGVVCVGSSGGRPSDGVWGGRFWKGDGPTARCSTRCSGMAWLRSAAGRR